MAQDKIPTSRRPQTIAETVGYAIGCIVAPARVAMPIRMWITVLASIAVVVTVFLPVTEGLLVKILCAYAALMGLVIGSAVFKRSAL